MDPNKNLKPVQPPVAADGKAAAAEAATETAGVNLALLAVRVDDALKNTERLAARVENGLAEMKGTLPVLAQINQRLDALHYSVELMQTEAAQLRQHNPTPETPATAAAEDACHTCDGAGYLLVAGERLACSICKGTGKQPEPGPLGQAWKFVCHFGHTKPVAITGKVVYGALALAGAVLLGELGRQRYHDRGDPGVQSPGVSEPA